MAGISLCCQEISVVPDSSRTSFMSFFSSPLPYSVFTGRPSASASGATVSRVRCPSPSSVTPAA